MNNGMARWPGYEDPVDLDGPATGAPQAGLVSLGFIGEALRRGARLWCGLAVVGLLLGVGVYVMFPPAYEATSSILLVENPNIDPTTAVQTDVALAQSSSVAEGVVHQLGLSQTPSSLLGSYTVTIVTNQVLTITASGPSSGEAVQRASAIAVQFLKIRSQYEKTQQQQTENELNQQVSQAKQNLGSVNTQLSQASTESDIKNLQAKHNDAANTLQQVQQYATQTLATTRTATQAMLRGSTVIDTAVAAKRSVLSSGLFYLVIGLVGGGILGLAIVIIGSITSDRLRRRDDIAFASGTPVRLSVGLLHGGLPFPGQAARRQRDKERVIEHLRNAVPGSSRGPAGLAVVAVDDTQTVASLVVALAVSLAGQRQKIVLADLSEGAHAARLCGVGNPGITKVNPSGVPLVVAVPDTSDVVPVGPLRSHASAEGYAQADQAVTAACANADLVLTVATLDPAFGGEHLATWSTDAVAVVTAGKSTVVRIHAVAEMIRLAGTRLQSVVVLNAEKQDESIGTVADYPRPRVMS